MNTYKVTLIGPAIVDVLAGPIGDDVFGIGTMPMEEIKLTYGGNAYNEAAALSRLGIPVSLISKVGNDEAGIWLMDQMDSLGIHTDYVIRENGLATSINIVLFDQQGERRFLTNPKGSQRRLSEEDIMSALDFCADIVCFTCMFISSLLDIGAMTRIFRKIKEKAGRTLVVDMTKAKNGEKLKDMEPLLKYVDYILPNEEELRLLSDAATAHGAEELLSLGAGCVIVKQGKNGCTVYHKEGSFKVHAYASEQAIDTTGAGDCFAAGFLYGLVNHKSLVECVQMANATASCCVECVGATEGIVSAEEPMRRYALLHSSEKGVI